ncbi:MAG: GFA family protein [Parvibaculaceae bacterium]
MTDWKLPWDGGCLCGQIRFRISAPPLLTMACHCTGCQKLSASAYSLTIAVPSEGFTVTQGETVIGGRHGPTRQLYCPHCKNWMFTHAHGLDFFVNVRATMLDQHDWYVPFVEVNTAEGLPWARTPAKHSFPTQPDLAGFAPLIEDFARDGTRPA